VAGRVWSTSCWPNGYGGTDLDVGDIDIDTMRGFFHVWAAVLRADPRWATWHRGPSALNCGSTGGGRADQIVAVRAASCSVKAGTDWPARSAQALITATAAASG
jgi:hypothetical protein